MNKRFLVKLPGNFYPHDFYGKNERDVRQQVRSWLNVNRLPRGTEIWRSDYIGKYEADFDYPGRY
jgi:hypothetical protein